jgi:Fe-S-cluster containining protein
MKRSVTIKDIVNFAQLDMVYNQVRMIEAKQNESKYKCLGSGKCCHIGLVIPMLECANIAFRLNQQYYLHIEDKGHEFAKNWMDGVIESLKQAMYDESWKPGGETEKLCAFYKGGCTIYGFRPMVCRSFGTITPVDDFCPRTRNVNGNIDFFSGAPVQKVVKNIQDLFKEYAKDKHENYDMSVYMPLGVLSFMIETEDLQKLAEDTDPKFWVGTSGWFNYRIEYTKLHGYSIEELEKAAGEGGKVLAFDPSL